jgi:hypothetical protein
VRVELEVVGLRGLGVEVEVVRERPRRRRRARRGARSSLKVNRRWKAAMTRRRILDRLSEACLKKCGGGVLQLLWPLYALHTPPSSVIDTFLTF